MERPRALGLKAPHFIFASVPLCNSGPMLYALAGLLLVVWFFGLAFSYTLSGFIHIFLLASIVVVLVRLVHGERRS